MAHGVVSLLCNETSAIEAERTLASHGAEEFNRQRRHYANGMGGLLIVGDADRVATTLAELSSAGLNGIAISFINYLDELPFFCDEVLPRLERLGLRDARPRQQARSA